MATVYKVQNMQLIADNSTHRAISEEDEATVDHHSVAVAVDLSVEDEVALMAAITKVLVNHSKAMVHHK
jgi:hypothetical protein